MLPGRPDWRDERDFSFGSHRQGHFTNCNLLLTHSPFIVQAKSVVIFSVCAETQSRPSSIMKGSPRPRVTRQDLADLRGRFGIAIRHLRRGHKFTQADLGSKAGLHRTYIADVERGARNPSLETIATLAGALGLQLSELFRIAQNNRALNHSRAS